MCLVKTTRQGRLSEQAACPPRASAGDSRASETAQAVEVKASPKTGRNVLPGAAASASPEALAQPLYKLSVQDKPKAQARPSLLGLAQAGKGLGKRREARRCPG